VALSDTGRLKPYASLRHDSETAFRFVRLALLSTHERKVTERTVLPSELTQPMTNLLVALRAHGRPALVAADGTHIELPDELYEVLSDVVAALSQGLAITVAPQHTVLTTGQAADLLGVSRPTLVRLLEAGEIPFDQPGRHRRIRLGDLLVQRRRSPLGDHAALRSLAS
jgi:excisionase family DNA binding protein